MSDFDCKWSDYEEHRLAELRAERPRNVRMCVSREQERARRPTGRRAPPPWARDAVAEQAEEREVMAAYEAAPPHVRAWLDGLVAGHLVGRKFPEIYRHRALLDVLVAWKHGDLADVAPDDEHAA